MIQPTAPERGRLHGRFPRVRTGHGPGMLVVVPGIDDATFDGEYGPLAATAVRWRFRRFLDGYTVYQVSRRRALDRGASIGDLAAE